MNGPEQADQQVILTEYEMLYKVIDRQMKLRIQWNISKSLPGADDNPQVNLM